VDIITNHTVACDFKGKYVAAIAKTGFDRQEPFIFNRLDGKAGGDPADKRNPSGILLSIAGLLTN
jgi:hypothetical protein